MRGSPCPVLPRPRRARPFVACGADCGVRERGDERHDSLRVPELTGGWRPSGSGGDSVAFAPGLGPATPEDGPCRPAGGAARCGEAPPRRPRRRRAPVSHPAKLFVRMAVAGAVVGTVGALEGLAASSHGVWSWRGGGDAGRCRSSCCEGRMCRRRETHAKLSPGVYPATPSRTRPELGFDGALGVRAAEIACRSRLPCPVYVPALMRD